MDNQPTSKQTQQALTQDFMFRETSFMFRGADTHV